MSDNGEATVEVWVMNDPIGRNWEHVEHPAHLVKFLDNGQMRVNEEVRVEKTNARPSMFADDIGQEPVAEVSLRLRRLYPAGTWHTAEWTYY